MTISDKDGKELASFSYTYDLAGNRLTSTELRDGKETKSEFSYDVNNRLTQVKTGDKVLTYAYDQNGNRIQSTGKDESLDYIYDTENRLLAVKDKEGMLFAALYDGDDNRVFTASRTQAPIPTSSSSANRRRLLREPHQWRGEHPLLVWLYAECGAVLL